MEPIPWLSIEMEGNRYLPKIDGQKMAVALFHAARDVAGGKFTNLTADAEEAFRALGLKPKPAALAGFLLQRAMTRAFQQIVEENRYRYGGELPDEKQTLAFFGREYGGRVLTPLNKDFFQKPHLLSFVGEAAEPFRKWLIAVNVPEAEAKRLAEIRFPLLLLYALNEEWRANPDLYKPILTASDTPFQKAAEQAYEWTQYRFGLQAQFSAEPLFDEDFALERVYIPLRAYREEREETERTAYVRDARRIRHVCDLELSVLKWLDEGRGKWNSFAGNMPRPTLKETLCVVSGGPGSGKSSFCKKLAARLAEEGRDVLYIPMHHFTLKGDMPASVGSFLDRMHLMSQNPLTTLPAVGERPLAIGGRSQGPLVLIFDGLDELAIQGRASEEAARTFLSSLKDYLRDENARKLCVQAIVSGREVVIQTHENELTGRLVLHLLPYFLSEEEIEPEYPSSRTYIYKDPDGLLREDQRNAWWRRYSEVKEGKAQEMPKPLKRDDLREITEQPLLNYLLALSYRRDKSKFATETNLNAIYADLLHAVYEKQWGGENVHAAGLGFKDFAAVLEEIGLAIWHGNGRTANLSDIRQQCAGLNSDVLAKFEEGAEKGVTRLLTAFYFRKTEAFDAPTFEFTHKSFGEFLTARRLVSSLYDIQHILSERSSRLGQNVQERALVEWARLFGPTPLDMSLLQFLRGETALLYRSEEKGKKEVEAFQAMLCRLIETMLRDGMPMHHSDLKLPTYADMDRQARNAEEALLAMLNACALSTQQTSDIAWSDRDESGHWKQPERAGTWLRRLCGQRTELTPYNPLAWNCLGWLNLSSCFLVRLDLQEANLVGANLYRAILYRADLERANLVGANLVGADLERAKLQEANLQEAHLEGAILEGANLVGANLVGANLVGANLQEAHLQEAHLFRAHLQEANLVGADLEWAILEGADLLGALGIEHSVGLDQAVLDLTQHGDLLARWKAEHHVIEP